MQITVVPAVLALATDTIESVASAKTAEYLVKNLLTALAGSPSHVMQVPVPMHETVFVNG